MELRIDRPLFKVGRGKRGLRIPNSRMYPSWRKLLQHDPCSYCGGQGGTIDHIRPQGHGEHTRFSGPHGLFSWLNLTSACQSCNQAKADKSLLGFMLERLA